MARTMKDVVAQGAGSPEVPQATPGVSKTGRPRGRPRKENKVVKVPSGRPRGRPKGSTKAAATIKALEASGASRAEIEAALNVQTPVKGPKGTGRRGRPPKSATTPSKTPTSASKAKIASTPNSAGKRGRGRPRKNPVDAPVEDEAPEESGDGEDAEGEEDNGLEPALNSATDNAEESDNDTSN